MASSKDSTPLQLVLQGAGSGSHYMVDIHCPLGFHRVQQLLLAITDPSTKATSIVWVTRTPNPKSGETLQPPLLVELAGRRKLQLCIFGLESDRGLQRHVVVCGGEAQLSGTENLYSVTLVQNSRGTSCPSLLNIISQKTFPLQLDKAQTEVTALPRVTRKSGALCLVLCQQAKPFQESLTFRTPVQGRLNNVHVSLPSRQDVKVKAIAMQNLHASLELAVYSVEMISTLKALTTYLSTRDLTNLKTMALNLRSQCKVKTVPLSHFFRNRWTSYFLDILTKKRGLMEKYDKDMNGDQHSAINGNIQGLFFSAALDYSSQQPPPFSLFGEWRLHIPAHVLFHKAINLYFADFYCHNEAHYITLVMTNAGSQDDRFCAKRLLKLDPYNNEFLYKRDEPVPLLDRALQQLSLHEGSGVSLQQRAPPTVFTTLARRVIIEVHYTESVNIAALVACYGRHQVYFTRCETMGAGRSRPSGIPKKGCNICNLPY